MNLGYELLDHPVEDRWSLNTENTDAPKAAEVLQVEPSRDAMFYFENVTILVDNTLFKVPMLPFQQGSEVFREMFSLPPPEGTVADGNDDAHPLRLDQIDKVDFRRFLKVLFSGLHDPTNPPLTDSFTVAEWTSVLKLATMWDFEVLRQTIIDRMTAMDIECVEKVVLAREYNVDSWLVPALNELARRQEPIQFKEVERLGVRLTLKMAAVRESIKKDRVCGNCRLVVGQRGSGGLDFSAKIQDVLARDSD